MWSQVVQKKHESSRWNSSFCPHVQWPSSPLILERWRVAERSRERDDIQDSLGLAEGTRYRPSLAGLQRLCEPKIEHADFLKPLELGLTEEEVKLPWSLVELYWLPYIEIGTDRPPQVIDEPNCLGADLQTCGAFIHDWMLLKSYRLLLTNRWLLIPYSLLKWTQRNEMSGSLNMPTGNQSETLKEKWQLSVSL